MATPKPPAFETLSLHAGQHPDPVTGARAVPIYQTTSYVFQDADTTAAALFKSGTARGHIYTRISNPDHRGARRGGSRRWKNGVGAICTASGMAALHLAIADVAQGAATTSSPPPRLYGGSINLLTHTLPRFGITTLS